MLLREKLKSVLPGRLSGKACFSAFRGYWRQVLSLDEGGTDPHLSRARFFDDRRSSPELISLVKALQTVRQRILANALIRSSTKWLVWVLAALLVIAAASNRLAGAVIAVAGLALGGMAAIVWLTWRDRPSRYESARRFDSAAGMRDRISTAVYLGDAEHPDAMTLRQRKDALARAERLDPRGLFPVRLPGNYRRAFALVLVVTGLFAYRIHHRAPLVALLQNTAHSQLVQSIFSPIVHAMEKDLQRTVSLVMTKPDAAGDETRKAEVASNTEDLWKADQQPNPGQDEPQNMADAGEGDQQQDNQLNAPGDQQTNQSGDQRQDSVSQSQEGKTGNENSADKNAQQNEQQGPEGKQSLGQSLMQALKNMMSNSPNQQSNRAAQQPPNSQGNPQSGNSHQPGATDTDKKGESRGSSDAKQKASQTASEGAGSQQGTKELRKDQEARALNAVPDRVALEASGFKEETRMKVSTDTGSAQLGVRDVAPQQDAVINGSEQENIPARYRFFVQRYFEHADNGKH